MPKPASGSLQYQIPVHRRFDGKLEWHLPANLSADCTGLPCGAGSPVVVVHVRPPRPRQQPPAAERRPPRVHRTVQAVVQQVAPHEPDAHCKSRSLHTNDMSISEVTAARDLGWNLLTRLSAVKPCCLSCPNPRLTFASTALSRPYAAAATTAAGSGGNTRRLASRGNLWWQPCSAKCAAMAHGCSGMLWNTCRPGDMAIAIALAFTR
jgi:hypothetical protein